MSGYIDQNKLAEFARHSTIGIDANDIMRFPTADVVEVVRCKDCVWWERFDDTFGYCNACKHGYFSEHWEISIHRKYKADFFCADGERRESK